MPKSKIDRLLIRTLVVTWTLTILLVVSLCVLSPMPFDQMFAWVLWPFIVTAVITLLAFGYAWMLDRYSDK